jgi:hypothetical protein
LAGVLSAKHPFWNSSVSNPSGVELLELFHKNEFEVQLLTSPEIIFHNSYFKNCVNESTNVHLLYIKKKKKTNCDVFSHQSLEPQL